MKRVAIVSLILSVACFTFAQAGSNQSQNPPQSGSQQQGAGQQPAPGTQGAQAAPAKHPPQAKTQPEFDAFKAASAGQDPATLEKAADDFAAKYPDSELRIILYKNAMRAYQNANNADKMLDMGRKALAIDGDDPEALVDVAEVLTERTRDTDLDKDQRLGEARKNAEKALQTVDTDIVFPASTPPENVQKYKDLLRSSAYSILGTLDFNQGNFTAAQANLQKSIDAYPQQPDPVTVLRLSLALDRQSKYPEALTVANRAVDLTQDGTPAGSMARRERDRLVQLTGGKPAGGGTSTGSGTSPQSSTPPAGASAPGQTTPPKQ
ncbi:MAG TPA: tetratricopeptide repeat protein [Terriglobales bacterium]|nr:tetratricopeptide repeat protein [Terriglobales bacterium]